MVSKIKHFGYCSSDIEMRGKCKRQCHYCQRYFAPLEAELNKRMPRKLKKRLKKLTL